MGPHAPRFAWFAAPRGGCPALGRPGGRTVTRRAASWARAVLALVGLLWLVTAFAADDRPDGDLPIVLELLAADSPSRDVQQARSAPVVSRGSSQLVLPAREHGSWVRVRAGPAPASGVLVVESTLAGEVTLWPPQGEPRARSKLRPRQDPGRSSYALAFPVPARAMEEGVLLHFAHQHRAHARVKLFPEADWHGYERSRLVLAAGIYAALAAFAVISACYWAVLRDAMFGDYTLFLLTTLVFGASNAGFIYGWPGGGAWAAFGIHGQWAMSAFLSGFALGFTANFLALRKYMPGMALLFRRLRVACLAAGVLVLASPVFLRFAGALLAPLLLAIFLMLFGVAVAMAARRQRYAFYFVVAWVPMTVAAFLRGMQGMGHELPFEPEYFFASTLVWQGLVLTLGIADQVLASRRERDVARQAAAQAEHLEVQNTTLKENVRLREEVERMSRHDLRTPLTSIVALPRLVREAGPVSPQQDELLTIVERAGYSVLNLVNLSLDLLKMEQGTYRFQPGVVDVHALLEKVLADLRPLARARRVEVVIEGGMVPRALARAEETLCYSILANLLKNAVEAAPEGSAVRGTVEAGTGQALWLHIHNEGVVPASVRDRFFDKYATAGKAAGSGFGTYSARLMAHIQEGELLMRTGETEGTTLSLRLQAAGAGDTTAASPAAVPGGLERAAGEWPPLDVLVVDDDEYNLVVMQHSLPSPPLRLRTATDGRSALELLAQQPADVVIMDLEMPAMDGFEAVARLRAREHEEHCRPTLVVALSSHEDEATRSRCLQAGFDLYLSKPAGRDELLRILRAAAAPGGAGLVAVAPPSPPPVPSAQAPLLLDPDLRPRLPGFLKTRLEAIDQMDAALAAGDVAQLRTLAHRLGGSFALHGFRWAAHACQRIEQAVREPGHEGVREVLAALRTHLGTVEIGFAAGATRGKEAAEDLGHG
jgi:CheY-like chemotaxis protein/signal transduction histidine kinase/HPt (histidine-containing phosphotransfer) domain-containing protein